MNRRVEIEGAVADGAQTAIEEQITSGVAVRMAVPALVDQRVRETRVGP